MSRKQSKLVTPCLINPAPARTETESLLNVKEGHGGITGKPDGTILTQDRPSGRGFEGRTVRRIGGVFAVAFWICLAFVMIVFTANTGLWSGLRQFKPIDTALNWLVPPPAPPLEPFQRRSHTIPEW
jgi:hypothetical protein